MDYKLDDGDVEDMEEAWKEWIELMAAYSKPHFTNI